MEFYQLKYFVEVAKSENMNQVTRNLGISTPALSKAIQLLEGELGIKLFDRIGKKLKLSHAGQLFLTRAVSILDLVQASARELGATGETLNISIAGREVFLSQVGLPFIEMLKKKHGDVQARLIFCSGEEALQSMTTGLSDFALTTQEPSIEFKKKVIFEFNMATWVGKGHPLFSCAKDQQAVNIKEVLKHPFAAPNTAVFGGNPKLGAFDGWSDNVFKRKIGYVTSSLQLLTELTQSGTCLSYLPDFYGKKHNLEKLKITGCDFKCHLKVYLSTSKYKKLGWAANAFDAFEMKATKGS